MSKGFRSNHNANSTISEDTMSDRDLDRISEQATADYLKRANKAALENMIGMALHAMSIEEMIDFLEFQIADLRDID
ncbi:hypothetical protein ACFFTN_01350 [Aminobacter aganoensis]|uniref:Uncharacterized protein n=1 Tax=Aminobacter aganoensis TaxID=83264 RepID=A0A7X0F5M1_9HYPH|nr:hypothetical protein [Aminobacter aganoensis]MBB6353495.1 hypothetical protein [Aminobacter aganoensis]